MVRALLDQHAMLRGLVKAARKGAGRTTACGTYPPEAARGRTVAGKYA
jgi:hypothetical protein